jgi:aspartyl-tRNA(Asn)/glutamyl-tRNA(Gln) amidotransferase subunit B
VARALDAEFARQVRHSASGGTIEQQTMLGMRPHRNVVPARTKEGSHDYRYFPEPDLPPLILSDEAIDAVRRSCRAPGRAPPTLPRTVRDLTAYDVDVLTSSAALGEYFEHVVHAHGDAKVSANWILGEVLARAQGHAARASHIFRCARRSGRAARSRPAGTISHTAAKQVFATMVKSGDPPAQIASVRGCSRSLMRRRLRDGSTRSFASTRTKRGASRRRENGYRRARWRTR